MHGPLEFVCRLAEILLPCEQVRQVSVRLTVIRQDANGLAELGFASRGVAKLPLGRMASAEEIADAAIWLSSSKSSFVTGHSLLVDGGFTAQ